MVAAYPRPSLGWQRSLAAHCYRSRVDRFLSEETLRCISRFTITRNPEEDFACRSSMRYLFLHVPHVGRGCSVSCGRPVSRYNLDRHTGGGGPRFHQFERSIRAGVGEQPRTLAYDHGKDEKVDLVDKIVIEQPAD